MAWVTFHHLVGWLEAGIGNLTNGQLLVVGLLSRDDWSICGKREVDTWVGHQVGLELGQVDVEGTIESQGSSDGADDLTNEPVQVGVGWSLNVQVAAANVVDGLVVNHESTVRVLQGGVGGQNGVVWFDDSGRHLRRWVDSKLQLGLLAIINRETLQEEGGETRSCTATKGVEGEESLETSALIGQLTDPVKDKIDDLLSDSVVTAGVVVGGVLFTSDELLGMEELAVGSSADLIWNMTGKCMNTILYSSMANKT
jgi:hypothetical protein